MADIHSINKVMIKRELFTDKVLILFSLISVLNFDKFVLQLMK